MMKKNTIGLFLGRFQPFHEGHKKCIEYILERHHKCLVVLRNLEVNNKDPFLTNEVENMIRKHFPPEKVEIITASADIDTVYIGRKVGYGLIQLDPKTEKISATDIRKKLYNECG